MKQDFWYMSYVIRKIQIESIDTWFVYTNIQPKGIHLSLFYYSVSLAQLFNIVLLYVSMVDSSENYIMFTHATSSSICTSLIKKDYGNHWSISAFNETNA